MYSALLENTAEPIPLRFEKLVERQARRLVIVKEQSLMGKAEYEQDQFIIETVNLPSLMHVLRRAGSDFSADAILISGIREFSEDLAFIRDFCRERSIPFILYEPKPTSQNSELFYEVGFDDAYSGVLGAAFARKIDLTRKIKQNKIAREQAGEALASEADVTKIKIWSLKRAFDIIVSFTAIVALSPVMALIALIIRLESKGPVIYISKRAGRNYKIFNFYKFRSMRSDADKKLVELAHLNQYSGSSFFKIKDDPRITGFGRFIRKTSLDEIPQLFNVLFGDMSLVGNRPLPLYEAEKLTKDQIAWRFLAPAGITGLWQVTKRGKAEMSDQERIYLDMEYAMKNSFWYDIKILFSTIPALLQKEVS